MKGGGGGGRKIEYAKKRTHHDEREKKEKREWGLIGKGKRGEKDQKFWRRGQSELLSSPLEREAGIHLLRRKGGEELMKTDRPYQGGRGGESYLQILYTRERGKKRIKTSLERGRRRCSYSALIRKKEGGAAQEFVS